MHEQSTGQGEVKECHSGAVCLKCEQRGSLKLGLLALSKVRHVP